MLKIVDLSVNIDNKNILHNFNLNINKGEIHAIMGPNGIGKSTICKTIMGSEDYKITNGKIYFNAEDLENLQTNETGKNVPIFEFNKKMEEYCDKLHIPHSFIHRGINEGMSGGERKKCELLHLWMLEPKLIILDELDSGLDVDSLNIVCQNLNEYFNTHDCGILLITHHKDLVEKLNATHIHIIKDGTIVSEGGQELAEKIEKEGYSAFSSTNKVSDNNERE